MSYHNETCGCAECGNYGQIYNPRAIHNQSCGCAECGNYPTISSPGMQTTTSKPKVVMVGVPVALLDDVRKFIAQRESAELGERLRRGRKSVK
jgi:hypothetical protein